MKVVWTPAARRGREASLEFLLARNRLAALQATERFVLAADSLAGFPLRGRRSASTGSREPVSVPPYVVVYEVADDLVRVSRVLHGAQRRE